MTDEELIARLRDACYLAFDDGTNDYGIAPNAADRIEALLLVRDGWSAWADDRHAKWVAEKARAERLEAALRFYADEDNYTSQYRRLSCECCSDDFIPVEEDRGETARATLTQKEQPDGE